MTNLYCRYNERLGPMNNKWHLTRLYRRIWIPPYKLCGGIDTQHHRHRRHCCCCCCEQVHYEQIFTFCRHTDATQPIILWQHSTHPLHRLHATHIILTPLVLAARCIYTLFFVSSVEEKHIFHTFSCGIACIFHFRFCMQTQIEYNIISGNTAQHIIKVSYFNEYQVDRTIVHVNWIHVVM